MGHEIIVYKGRSVILHDMNLWTLRHFLLLEAERRELYELTAILRSWNWIGPGVIMNVDDLSSFIEHGESQRREFLTLLDWTANRLRAFGVEIPIEYFERNINTKIAYYIDGQPIAVWLIMIGQLRDLVTEDSNSQPV